MDDKQGKAMVIYLDKEENELVVEKQKHEGLVNKNVAVRKIIREYGGLETKSFLGYKND